MRRAARIGPGQMVFRVLNRRAGGMPSFSKDGDYATFEGVLADTLQTRPTGICRYCLIPNHWDFLVWPERDGQSAAFMPYLTTKCLWGQAGIAGVEGGLR